MLANTLPPQATRWPSAPLPKTSTTLLVHRRPLTTLASYFLHQSLHSITDSLPDLRHVAPLALSMEFIVQQAAPVIHVNDRFFCQIFHDTTTGLLLLIWKDKSALIARTRAHSDHTIADVLPVALQAPHFHPDHTETLHISESLPAFLAQDACVWGAFLDTSPTFGSTGTHAPSSLPVLPNALFDFSKLCLNLAGAIHLLAPDTLCHNDRVFLSSARIANDGQFTQPRLRLSWKANSTQRRLNTPHVLQHLGLCSAHAVTQSSTFVKTDNAQEVLPVGEAWLCASFHQKLEQHHFWHSFFDQVKP